MLSQIKFPYNYVTPVTEYLQPKNERKFKKSYKHDIKSAFFALKRAFLCAYVML